MNTKNIFITFLLNLTFITTFAQGENDNWYFGSSAALNFSNPTPTVLNNSAMSADSACGTISDSNGNLLFYCNAKSIWNRQNQTMPNGTGLSGFSASAQLAIVKNPTNINQYFVFTTSDNNNNVGTNNRISYSIIDMSLGPLGANGLPLGDVVQNLKNIPVVDNLGNNFGSGAITVVAGNISNTYWLLIPNGNSLFSYKIDNQGFANGNPIISNLNFPTTLNTGKFYTIKTSPKLTNINFSNYICISHFRTINTSAGTTTNNTTNKVLSFNSTTGSVTNHYSLNVNGIQSYLPEFNQDASVLFLGYTNKIYAVDLLNSTTGNVNFMQIYADSITNRYIGIQRNKYGDVYITRNASNFLGKVNNPNIYSSSMSVNMNAIGLYGATMFGLPQLVPYFENVGGYYPCIDDLVLTQENNLSFYYEIGNTITTKDKYILGGRHNITMQAGQNVNLLPGTHIQNGANYHAFIAPCRQESISEKFKQNLNQKGMVLNLDMEERKALEKEVDIYPNPASTYTNIDSGTEKLISWELYDLSGKNILQGSSKQINVQSLPKASYLLKIKTDKKQVTKKVIVK